MSVENDLAEAFLTLLGANAALTVFDGRVPDPMPDPPYALVYSLAEWPREGAGNALGGDSVTCNARWYTHCVGLTAAAARAVAGQVRATVLDKVLTVPGRACGPIQQDEAPPVVRDEITGRAVYDAVAVYSTLTVPT